MLYSLQSLPTVLAAEVITPISSEDVIIAGLSRAEAAGLFGAYLVLASVLISLKSTIGSWLTFGALGLTTAVLVITNGPMLEMGASLRNFIRARAGESSNAEFWASGGLTVVLVVILYLSFKSWRKNMGEEDASPVAPAVIFILVALVLATTPWVQTMALAYADYVAVPMARLILSV